MSTAPKVDEFIRSAVIVSWHDGDTVIVNVDNGYNQWLHDEHLRLKDVWAAELWTDEGKRVQACVAKTWPVGEKIIVQTYHAAPDSFTRFVARVWDSNGDEIGPQIVAAGWATAKETPTA